MRLGRTATLLVALSLLTSAATASAEGAWVLWEHSYEVWVDSNKENHRPDLYRRASTASGVNRRPRGSESAPAAARDDRSAAALPPT
jgi:hypothetical protein